MERRLAAILAADVVGYSRLVRADEEGTIAALRALRAELIDPHLVTHHGRIVKLMGDGILVEFASVVDAARAGIAIQRDIAAHGADTPSERRIELRIGINLGDVIIDGDDIQGDGVNIAARLEALAQAGGVCVSDSVHDQIRDRLEDTFEDLGEQEVKNISRPIRAWHWSSSSPDAATPAIATDAPALLDKPSIAVLPFANMSADPEQEFFADGITEDIITALSKFRWLFVIARNSTFIYKGQNVDIREVGRTLGVRYALEGSVRRAGNRVRITAQLIDSTDGTHIWAENMDGTLDDIFELQDQVTLEVVGAIEPSLRQAEIDRLRVKPTEDLRAYELYLRALSHFDRLTDADNREAINLLSRAVQADPGYAIASGLLAWAHVQRRVQNWSLEDDEAQRALTLARQVTESDRADAMALAYAAHVIMMFGRDPAAAREVFDRFLRDNLNSALANTLAAANLASMDAFEQGLFHAEQALRLSPMDTFRYSFNMIKAIAHYGLKDASAAVESARTAIADRRNFLISHYILIGALAQAGDMEGAERAARDLLTLAPLVTVPLIKQTAPMLYSAHGELFMQALLKAGIPE